MKNRTSHFIKPYIIQIFFSALFLAVAAITTIGFAFFLGGMVDAAINQDLSNFKTMAILSICAMVIELCFEMIGHIIRHNYSYKATSDYKKSLLMKTLSLEINKYSRYSEAHYLNIISSESTVIKEHYFMQFPAIIHNAIQVILAIAALIFINWKFFCVVIILFIFSSVLPNIIGGVQGKKAIIASDKNERFLSYLNSVLGAFELIKTFNIAERISRTFSEYCLEGEKSNYRVETIETVRNVFSAASSFVIQMGAILAGVFLVFKGELTIGHLFVGIQVIGVVVAPITDLFQRISWVKSTDEMRKKHEELLGFEVSGNQGKGIKIDNITSLTANNLAFKYEDGFGVHNINISFSRGKKYAIIGESGSGKTTILKLLLGYFENYSGAIEVNNIEMRDIDKNSYYEKLSVMNQNVVLFEDTIDNNIKLFRSVDDNAYAEVIAKANLVEVVERFTKGDEILSCDNISAISGGEKQRIALARCLLSDADAIIFDEATAALDPDNARVIYDTVLEMKDVMLITVTHDWSDELLSRFDEVIYVSDGTIKYTGVWDKVKKFTNEMIMKG